jgi:hypothetical protein
MSPVARSRPVSMHVIFLYRNDLHTGCKRSFTSMNIFYLFIFEETVMGKDVSLKFQLKVW